MEPDIIVDINGVSKAYAGVQALDNVSFDIRAGEVHGLVGENGAGKSTIIKILAGAVTRDSGTLTVSGNPVELNNERASDALGFRFIHQDIGVIDRLTVAENVFLGKPLPRWGPFISKRETRRQAREVLADFTTVDPAERIQDLSIAKRWMVAVGRACSGDPRLVVMDEPTVALSDVEVRLVIGAIARLRERGIAVLFVSHRLVEVLEVSDRITVMKDGRSVGTHDNIGMNRSQLVSLIVGEEMGDTTLQAPSPIEPDAPVILQATGLCGGPLRDIDLELRAGEILGIAGLVGSGRTSLLQQLFGVHRPTAGAIRYEGREVTIKSPADAIKLGMAMIPEERRSEGLLLLRSVRENAVLAHLKRFRWDRRLGVPSRRKEREATEGQIKALSIRTSGSEQRVSELSGGNQQKVLVARWLLGSGLKVLILDEPTKGVDVGAKAEIFGIVRQLAMGGVGVLLVSSDLEEVAEVCHRAVVLVEGRLGGEVVSPFSESDILAVCYEGARA